VLATEGKPLEYIFSGVRVAENYCSSCSCLTGSETYCRTIQYNGKTYEEIPEEIIRKAVFKILESDNKKMKK